MKVAYLILFLSAAFYPEAQAQNVNSAYLLLGDGSIILSDFNSCTSTQLISPKNSGLGDIAEGDNLNELYGISNSGILYRYDLNTDSETNLGFITYTATITAQFNSLVREGPGTLLAVNGADNGPVFRIDVATRQATLLGYTGFNSAGDLTFFEGNLYLSAAGNELVRIDLNNPSNSAQVGTMGNSLGSIFGVVSVIKGEPCSVSAEFNLVATGSNSTALVDPSTAAISVICPNLTSETIFGAAEVRAELICRLDAEILAPDEVCENDAVTLSLDIDPPQPYGTYQYAWREQGQGTILSTNASLSRTFTQTGVIECTITDTGLLPQYQTVTATRQITVVESPELDPLQDILMGSDVVLPVLTGNNLPASAAYYTGSSGTGIRFEPGERIERSQFASYPVTLFAYAENSAGCVDEINFQIFVSDPGLEIRVSENPVCPGDLVVLTAIPLPSQPQGNYLYSWRKQGESPILSTDPVYATTLIESTLVECTVTDTGLPQGSDSAVAVRAIQVIPVPEIEAIEELVMVSVLELPELTGNNLPETAAYYSGPGGQGTRYFPGEQLNRSQFEFYPVTLYAYAENQLGCSDETVVRIIFQGPDGGNIFIPPYFTPNSDGYHDFWQIERLSESVVIRSIFIFDRFGKLLKQLNPDSQGWDGTYRGLNMPSTDYWFSLTYEVDGTEHNRRGHFTLKR